MARRRDDDHLHDVGQCFAAELLGLSDPALSSASVNVGMPPHDERALPSCAEDAASSLAPRPAHAGEAAPAPDSELLGGISPPRKIDLPPACDRPMLQDLSFRKSKAPSERSCRANIEEVSGEGLKPNSWYRVTDYSRVCASLYTVDEGLDEGCSRARDQWTGTAHRAAKAEPARHDLVFRTGHPQLEVAHRIDCASWNKAIRASHRCCGHPTRCA